MSDLRLRELERRWRQTDAVEDEVAYLRERLRAGDLLEPRLRLAAWLGHPAAERLAEVRFEPRDRAKDALAGLVQAPELVQGALARWGDGLIAFGQDAALRAALADARRCLAALGRDGAQGATRAWTEAAARTWVRVLTEAVDAATRAVLVPTTAHVEAAREALRDRQDPRLREWLSFGAAGPRQAWNDLLQAAWALAVGLDGQPIEDWWHYRPPEEGTDPVVRYHALRGALQAEVLPWALGWRDPLRELPARALDALVDAVDALEVASPCRASWDAMPAADPGGRARTCGECQERVYDVTSMDRAEVEALLREHGGQRLCVRFYRREDGRVVTRDCPEGLERRKDGATPRPRLMGIRIAPR